MSGDNSERTSTLFKDCVIWDAHSGFLPDLAADLRKLRIWREAGVDFLSVDVGFDIMPWEKTVATLAAFRHWILRHPEEYVLVTSAEEVRRAKMDRKLAIAFDIEGMNALDGRIEMIELFHSLGVRQILFAYNRNNLAGGGCHDDDCGLTAFGKAAIDEMNRLGMFVDATHCGYRTSMEAMEYSGKPVIFSHSNPKALRNHGRNITDDQIRACARTGGIVGVVGLSMFLGDGGTASARVADHIEYIAEIAGPAHVGIGLDFYFPVENASIEGIFDGNPEYWPESEGYGKEKMTFVEPRQLPEIAEILFHRGFSEEEVRGVMGENFLRLANQIWR